MGADDHRDLLDKNYVVLIECDPQRNSSPADAGHVKPEQAHRIGWVANLKREAFAKISE
ncbi:hypothetical protein [Burkholderia sp. WAC0059]|uniref:hypothetical protein n=1 Tax=Burkholderia sp. WAC0059 TaxID=2066022 RepID=UPI0015E06820|nr:hypothetical protein [Burkholderia sp. WAC0059]